MELIKTKSQKNWLFEPPGRMELIKARINVSRLTFVILLWCGWVKELNAHFHSAASLRYPIPVSLRNITQSHTDTLATSPSTYPDNSNAKEEQLAPFLTTLVYHSPESKLIPPDPGVDTIYWLSRSVEFVSIKSYQISMAVLVQDCLFLLFYSLVNLFLIYKL